MKEEGIVKDTKRISKQIESIVIKRNQSVKYIYIDKKNTCENTSLTF